MSDTPRTDAAWAMWIKHGDASGLKRTCDQLERELNAFIKIGASEPEIRDIFTGNMNIGGKWIE